MLIYHDESDSLFWDPEFDFSAGADAALCMDVTDQHWAIDRARKEGIDMSDDFMEVPDDLIKSTGGMSGAITAAMAKWARKPADLYPTPADCTYSLLPHIQHLLPAEAVVLEPACADGQMVNPLQEFGFDVDGYDLRPEVLGGVGGVDFLDKSNGMFGNRDYDAVITNPPFSAAEAFIRRAIELAPVAVMLLKAQYWNTKNRRKLFRETKPCMELNLTWRPAFLEKERGKSPLMDCMWVVWVRGHEGDCITRPIDRILECPVNVNGMDFGGL